MNNKELLSYIFDGVEGEVVLFQGDNEFETVRAEDLPSDMPFEKTCVELLVDNERCVGVVVDDAELATFSLSDGKRTVHVALFEHPVPVEDVPEDVDVTMPLLFGKWQFIEGTDTFYAAEAVFGVSDGVTETDTEGTDASAEPLEDQAVGGEDRGVGHPVGDEAARGEGTTEPVDPPGFDAADPDGTGIEPEGGEEAGASGPSGREGETEPADHVGGAEAQSSADAADDPELVNDCYLLGKSTPAFEAILERPAKLMLGAMWGQRDHRNTQDGDWAVVEMPWSAWIMGADKTKNTPAWGFSRHPVGKDKEGACVVLGASIGKARKAKAMEYMYAMGIDVDSGARLDDVIAKIEDLGLFCIVYTSFNHYKRGLQLKRDDVLRKLQIKSDPTLAQIKEYLQAHSKSRYEADFIANVKIKDAKLQTKEGVVIDLETPPLEKFRLIFPLEEPVKLIDLAPSQAAALEVWEDKITGLAVETLGVHFDTSCTDPSRLFYTARHPKDAEDWYCAIVQGDPLRFEDVPAYRKASYTAKRDALNPFELAGGADGADERPPMALTPSGKSLNDWHSTHKSRLMLADLLEAYCPDRIRVAGGEANGHVHVECPFEHEHSKEGGTATMAVNSLDSQSGYWTWFCHHDACQGRHKLQFMEEALRQEWFPEDLLWDMDAGFLLPPEDGQEDEQVEEEQPEEVADETPKTPEQLAEAFDTSSSQEDIAKFLKKLHRKGADLTVRANVTAVLAKNTNLGKREIKNLWNDLDAEKREKDKARQKEEEGGEAAAVVNEWDFVELCEYGHRRIHDTNNKSPQVFHYMENLCVIRENSEGHARMKFLDKDGFSHHLNNVARFVRVNGEKGSSIGVSAPDDVVKYLYAADYGTYPALRGLVSTPTFTRNGQLLTKEGYDRESRLFYKPDMALVVPTVRAVPTDDEVTEAKRLLVEEVLADFPLGALTRTEIMEQAFTDTGIPAVANMLALILLPFMREMVDGPTPGHLLVKPAPGTGASLLTDVFSIIATGRVTPALIMPTNNDEMSKTLTSVLSNGQNVVFFDNINHSVDSGELASAMTAPTYQARLLGKSQTVEVDVRCAWVFTGNNVTLSSELVRRLVMVDLDARVANPEMRTEFRHADIRGWVQENRGTLVWACLTLIQNFVAKGMPIQNDAVLASYENWSRMVGGVLKAAGIRGFMENRTELRSKASDESDDDLLILLEAWWDHFGTKATPIRGDDKAKGLTEMVLGEDIQLPIRQTVTADGDRTYQAKAFGGFLSKFKDRVFRLEDGTEVKMTKTDKRTRHGSLWQLTKMGMAA